MTIGEGEIQSVIKDHLGKTISVGHKIVYPTRPGGKGPLQLGVGFVMGIDVDRGVLAVATGVGRQVTIDRTDRVAIVI